MTSIQLAESTKELLGERQQEYAAQLKGSIGEQWLQSRGLTSRAMGFFGLGYVETPMKGDRLHQGRVTIPYFTRTGIVALRSTSIPDANGGRPEPKYLPWMTGDLSRPYNSTALDGSHEEITICEGEMDTMTAWMLGMYAVGIPGVSNWKDVYRPLFRYRRVTIIADNDDAGQGNEFAKTIASKLGGCQIAIMPKGYDLNSYFAEHGEENTKKYLAGGDAPE